MQKEIDKQKDATAWSTARTTVAFRNKNLTKEELARNYWIDKRLNFDAAQAMKEYDECSQKELQKLHDEEYTRLVQAEEFRNQCKKKAADIFVKVLVPATIEANQPLSWDYIFTGNTGLKSPKIREMLSELFDAASEPLCLTNVKEFASQISQKYDGQQFEFSFEAETRRTNFQKQKKTVIARFVLRASHFPVNEL